MCPLCIGSALLVLTGAGSAGGLAVIVARAVGAHTAPPSRDSGEPPRSAAEITRPGQASIGYPAL